MGVEPTSSAWEADILPMNYARVTYFTIIYLFRKNFNTISSCACLQKYSKRAAKSRSILPICSKDITFS